MTSPLIERVSAPRGPEDPAISALHAIAAISSADAMDLSGHDDLAYPARTRLGWLTHERYYGNVALAASLPGEGIVGFAWLLLPLTGQVELGELELVVHLAHRRRGVGTALLRAIEREAQARGRTQLLAWSEHAEAKPGMDALDPPTGHGRIARTDATARFALGHGYRLEQVERLSTLRLPVPPERLAELFDGAASAAGPDYAVHTWAGDAPPRWGEDIAYLTQRMSTDTPSGEMDLGESQWDAEKVAYQAAVKRAHGVESLYSAVEHVPSGRLVGYTNLERSTERPHGVLQENTIVVPEHRGHRLGMLLKAANLRLAADQWPGARRVHTSNAEENSYMLAINEAIGFASSGAFAAWLRTLASGA